MSPRSERSDFRSIVLRDRNSMSDEKFLGKLHAYGDDMIIGAAAADNALDMRAFVKNRRTACLKDHIRINLESSVSTRVCDDGRIGEESAAGDQIGKLSKAATNTMSLAIAPTLRENTAPSPSVRGTLIKARSA